MVASVEQWGSIFFQKDHNWGEDIKIDLWKHKGQD